MSASDPVNSYMCYISTIPDIASVQWQHSITSDKADNEWSVQRNKPEPSHQVLLLHQQVQQQFACVAVRLLNVLKILSFFDCVHDLLCIRTLDVATLHAVQHGRLLHSTAKSTSCSFTMALVQQPLWSVWHINPHFVLPLYMLTDVFSWHPMLRIGSFSWSKVLLSDCPCWRQVVYSVYSPPTTSGLETERVYSGRSR